MENINKTRASVEGFIAMGNLFKEVLKTVDKTDGVTIISEGIDFYGKTVHIFAGIDYLAYAMGADTYEEAFGVGSSKMKKSFKYDGWTFFELSEDAGNEGYYYR